MGIYEVPPKGVRLVFCSSYTKAIDSVPTTPSTELKPSISQLPKSSRMAKKYRSKIISFVSARSNIPFLMKGSCSPSLKIYIVNVPTISRLNSFLPSFLNRRRKKQKNSLFNLHLILAKPIFKDIR